LVTVPHQAQPIITHLNRYILREDVHLEDTTLSY
jgi:folate-binding Fe-S cluster repair protein YgfZ